jgi:hypothetical protein
VGSFTPIFTPLESPLLLEKHIGFPSLPSSWAALCALIWVMKTETVLTVLGLIVQLCCSRLLK